MTLTISCLISLINNKSNRINRKATSYVFCNFVFPAVYGEYIYIYISFPFKLNMNWQICQVISSEEDPWLIMNTRNTDHEYIYKVRSNKMNKLSRMLQEDSGSKGTGSKIGGGKTWEKRFQHRYFREAEMRNLCRH